MTTNAEKYINPFTDFGFKKLFGTEVNKDLLYEDSLKKYRDLNNALATAEMKGELKGRIEGELKGRIEGELKGKMEGKIEEKTEIAEKAIAMGMSIDDIIKLTALSEEQIKGLIK